MKLLVVLLFLVQVIRVYSWSPTNSYKPGKVDCPDGDLVRTADSLSDEETKWLKGRQDVLKGNLIDFLLKSNMSDFDAEDFVNNAKRIPTIGVAFSGGGYRAMLCGAGQLSALDNRTDGGSEKGLGGLLQASTYLAGLSGGSWLVGTIAMNNFTSVQDIMDGNRIWKLKHGMLDPGGWNVINDAEYYDDISDDIQSKKDAGFELSLTDTWGRALSYQLYSNYSNAASGLTWSTLQEADVFKNYEMPFPLVVADGRAPYETIISGNSTIMEINPFEMGSWDPSIYSFMKVKYLGTNVKDGKSNGTCVAGYDNAGFIVGSSSTLFNQFVLQINTTSIPSFLKSVFKDILGHFSKENDDIALYQANPFKDVSTGDNKEIKDSDSLYVVDGGEDGQNIPLYPLLQPERHVDVVFAYDNSADTEFSWPDGTSLMKSYERQGQGQGNGTVFPYVPDNATFINLNLTAKPTFFGCDAKNLTSLFDNHSSKNQSYSAYDVPLVVYTANRPFSYESNISTFKLSYEDAERNQIIKNGFETASRLNRTADEEDDFRACVGCAIIRREQERNGQEQSDQCKACFKKYCWDGKLDTSDTPGVNFTQNGLTSGPQNNGVKTSEARALLEKEGILKMLGYSAFVALTFVFSF